MFKMPTFWKSYKSLMIEIKIDKKQLFDIVAFLFSYVFSFIPNTNFTKPLKNFGTFFTIIFIFLTPFPLVSKIAT